MPWSADVTVQDAIGRLASNRRVRAVSLLGSTGTPEWTDASDVDLCILLNDYSAGVGLETTIIEGRIADIVLVGCEDAEAMLRHTTVEREAAQSITPEQWPFVHWLAEARPVHDPDGIAGVARDRAARLASLHAPAVAQQTARRFLSHDVRVNANLLARSHDPILEVALGMRQLHTFVSAVQAWSTVRGIRRRGWKKDLAHIAEVDPHMYDLIRAWHAATDLRSRHEIFVQAVERALEPLGGLVPVGRVIEHPHEVWPDLGPAGLRRPLRPGRAGS